MTSCCHCGRALYYAPSVKRHSGSWCYYNKGPCRSNYDNTHDEPEHRNEGFKMKLAKILAMGAISGAALGVTCVLSHGACIIALFLKNHEYLKYIVKSVYSVLKNNSEHDKHSIEEVALSGALETSNAAGDNALFSKLGDKFARITSKAHSTSLCWAREIGTETGKGMLESGSSAVFDWYSKAIV